MFKALIVGIGWMLSSSFVYGEVRDSVQDLDFMYLTLLENHPGVYNVDDPLFTQALSENYQMFREKAQALSDPSEGMQVLQEFCQSFDDSHLRFHGQASHESLIDSQLYKLEKLSEPASYWVSLPTFSMGSQETQNSFATLLDELSHIPADGVCWIFDLRGNTGGNSDQGLKILQTLFGPEYVNYRRFLWNQNVRVDWRVSQGNIAHLHHLSTVLKDSSWAALAMKMQERAAHAQHYYTEVWYTPQDKASYAPIPKKNHPSKIIALIDERNNSAALDFLDDLIALDFPVLLIGQKTCVDRVYMEVRSLALPSQQGSFQFPIKVYRNRPRGDRQGYCPDYQIDLSSEEQVQSAVKDCLAFRSSAVL